MSGPRPRVAWLTNDLPPASGGIQQFVASLLARTADATTLVVGPVERPTSGVLVDTPPWSDTAGSWRTERASSALIPTPAVTRWAVEQIVRHQPEVVVIASLWPLGRMARAVRRATGVPVLGLTHGAEAGLARGVVRPLLRAVARDVDVVTVISDHTAEAITAALPGHRIERLAPGVDVERFERARNLGAAAQLRTRWGVPSDALVVGCIARLVPRKGQDVLLQAWGRVNRRHPSAHLVLVGEGPLRRRLVRASAGTPSVHVVGPVTWDELPAAHAALDVFAMPVRTRRAGLDVEGLGISYLEAQASGVPVVVGRSGGAPETLTDGRVGSIVDGRQVDEVVDALDGWLSGSTRRAEAARLGPEAALAWSWDGVASRFDALIDDLAARSGRR